MVRCVLPAAWTACVNALSPRDWEMLIYLDANMVQYCADYGDFVFDRESAKQPPNRNLKMELRALGEVIEMAIRAEVQDLDHRWDVAAPRHLLEEFSRGKPSQEQLDTYRSLREAWHDLGIEEHGSPDVEVVSAVESRLRRLNLRDPLDRRHLAEAVAIGASWFITLDKDILEKTRDEPNKPTAIEGAIVGRPSELRARMTFDAVFGLRLAEGSLSKASTVRLQRR
jgi:hypothetical protein